MVGLVTGSVVQWPGRLFEGSPPDLRFAYPVSLLPAEIVSILGEELWSRRIASYTPIGESGLVERTPAVPPRLVRRLTGRRSSTPLGANSKPCPVPARSVAPTLTQPLPRV